MPSSALTWWNTGGKSTLDEIEVVHTRIGGVGRGRRYALAQLNNAYAVLLSSQFQKFCRDLHSQSADYLASLAPRPLSTIVLVRMTEGRKLDTGNPNPGNIGSDFGRFGLNLWQEVQAVDHRNQMRHATLSEMNEWRNAIAHHDFTKPVCGGRASVQQKDVRRWRQACNALTLAFDQVMAAHLRNLSGVAPW
jgi:hypothetical protein